MSKLKVLDLFSGIGGFSLGLERTGGFETVAFCEIDPFCQKVLAKHWPNVEIHNDVTSLKFKQNVDLVTAGFPCQDISYAGDGAGITGERSGLFWYVIRTLCMVGRPRVLLENVAGLLTRGLGSVLGALATFGYDSEWHCIPASAAGSPQNRDRIWILSYPTRSRERREFGDIFEENGRSFRPMLQQLNGSMQSIRERGDWLAKSTVCRVADGLPHQLDRTGSLGNAVVPQIPEMIGYAILEAERVST